jgi:hypothetical protein
MTEERFAALAAAYGADIGRWPEGEREAARRLAGDDRAMAALDAEAALDHLMWQASTPAPSLALTDAVVALAPRPRPARGPLARWLTGVGVTAALAAAGAAGVAIGAVLTPHALINAVLPAHATPNGEEAIAVDAGWSGDIG